MIKKVMAIVLLGAMAAFAGEAKPASESGLFGFKPTDLTMAGRNLSSGEAEQLEKKLLQDPNDLAIRIKLAGYYFAHQFQSDTARKNHQRYALWIIEHRPADEAAGIVEVRLDPYLDKESFTQAKAIWLKHLDKNKKDPRILWNAAEFLSLYDAKMSESLLQQGQKLEPMNYKWAEKLGTLYSFEIIGKTGELKQKAAAKALAEYEKALGLTKDELSRDFILVPTAKMAIEANDLVKAKKYATQLLNERDKGWNYGNAVHIGNIVLGRAALKEGNIKSAKEYLIAAGKTPGSPQLNSFGPNMSLAKELLEKGERKVVLEYLELCGKFWAMGKQRLKDWTTQIEKGQTPNFDASLYY